MDPSTAIAPLLTGAWWLDSRASGADARFVRLTFYRDARFGLLAVDRRTMVYGSWRLSAVAGPTPASSTPVAHVLLTLRFDHQPDPSSVFELAIENGAVGPLSLVETPGRPGLVLRRPAPIEALLVGAWHAPLGDAARPLDALELNADATYARRGSDGATQLGRWGYVRDGASSRGVVRGALLLEPDDVAQPAVRARTILTATAPPSLELALGSTTVALSRRAAPPPERALVAIWRLVFPSRLPAPHEIVLRANGGAEVLPRAGTPRLAGRWEFTRGTVSGAALEGTLTLSLDPPGGAPRRDEQQVALPFTRLGELQIHVRGTREVVRYRRLIR